MLNNIKIIIKACDKLNLSYETPHKSQNLLVVKIANDNLIFSNGKSPFNTESIAHICKDKDFSYNLLHKYINMPRTISFVDPNTSYEYIEYIEASDYNLISDIIENGFNFPVIVKKNSGSQGCNVFKCNTKQEILDALAIIYDKKDNKYDYVAIAQEYIDIQREFRVILFQSKIMLVYEKIIDKAKFIGNLSPLHWENAKTVIIDDEYLLQKIQESIQGISNFKEFQYIGLDLVLDKNNKFWVIELNSHPGYNKFLKDNNERYLVDMYIKILQHYI